MARRLVGSGAFATSLVAHALFLAVGAFVLSRSLGQGTKPRAIAAAPREVEVELPAFGFLAGDSQSERPSPVSSPATPAPPTPGGGPLERRPDTEDAGRGGSRTAEQAATNLASSIDPLTLETEQLTHLNRSQIQRLHTAAWRRSWEGHRSTPNPMQLTFLATGSGVVRERRAVGATTQGSVAGAQPAALGGTVGAATDDAALDLDSPGGSEHAGEREPPVQLGAVTASKRETPSSRARVLLARPWVMRARPALPTEQHDRPNDTTDSSEAVASRVAALIHASTLGGPQGPGFGGEPVGGLPGRAGDPGMGSRASASGFGPGPDAMNDPGIQGYIARLKQRVDEQLKRAFPDSAIEAGKSGHVIFELEVLANGSVARVRLVRPSGIAEYDGNVMRGVRSIPSFGRLPQVLGSRALFTMSYDALNRVVGREGPGPGGYGKSPRPMSE